MILRCPRLAQVRERFEALKQRKYEGQQVDTVMDGAPARPAGGRMGMPRGWLRMVVARRVLSPRLACTRLRPESAGSARGGGAAEGGAQGSQETAKGGHADIIMHPGACSSRPQCTLYCKAYLCQERGYLADVAVCKTCCMAVPRIMTRTMRLGTSTRQTQIWPWPWDLRGLAAAGGERSSYQMRQACTIIHMFVNFMTHPCTRSSHCCSTSNQTEVYLQSTGIHTAWKTQNKFGRHPAPRP